MKIREFLVLAILFEVTCCKTQPRATNALNCGELSIKSISSLVGQKIMDIKAPDCFRVVITNVEGDEGRAWYSADFYVGEQLVFYCESNWEDTDHISRITILSKIKEKDVNIGVELRDIRKVVNDKVEASDDESLLLRCNSFENTWIQMDVSNFPVDSLLLPKFAVVSNLPDSIKVDRIIIMK